MSAIMFHVFLALCLTVLVSADEDRKTPAPPTPKPGCLRASDCPSGNCCVLNKTINRGACKPLQASRQTCYWKQVNPRPDPQAIVTSYDLCPCGFGTSCSRLEGKSHPTYGPLGICTWD
ncbi:venom protein 164-like [Physella acuta]|uniref:venom protein 164-like n=1 Tax=Physella acuta TaxID=109671 RepID=UPI0027DBAC60|nr:venom protein 164-like [Physella acuta]XP_059145946.1 venom protein 164-like [Physella acuta]